MKFEKIKAAKMFRLSQEVISEKIQKWPFLLYIILPDLFSSRTEGMEDREKEWRRGET